MGTDVSFDTQDLYLDAGDARLHVQAEDLLLAAKERQTTAGPRRALVHAPGDSLVVNFNGDYPAGVEIHGGQVQVPGALFVGTPGTGPGGSAGPTKEGGIDDGLEPIHFDDHPELNPDAMFGEPEHALPLNVVYELRFLRRAVMRLHERLEALGG